MKFSSLSFHRGAATKQQSQTPGRGELSVSRHQRREFPRRAKEARANALLLRIPLWPGHFCVCIFSVRVCCAGWFLKISSQRKASSCIARSAEKIYGAPARNDPTQNLSATACGCK